MECSKCYVEREEDYRELLRISEGNATLDELARVLKRFETMHMLPPSKDLLNYLIEYARSMGKSDDEAFQPHVHGTLNDGMFIPAVFTHPDFAYHIAEINGFMPQGDAIMIPGKSWAAGLHEFLAWGYGGIILDGGQPHKQCLNKDNLARLVAVMNLDFFKGLEDIRVATDPTGLHLQDHGEGRKCAFVYDTESGGQWGQNFMRYKVAGAQDVVMVSMSAAEFIKRAVDLEVFQTLVNYGLDDQRHYNLGDFQ